MSESMRETIEAEVAEAVQTLQRANDLLMKIFNTEVDNDD